MHVNSFKISRFYDPSLWALLVLTLTAIPVHFWDRQIFMFLNGSHTPLTDIFWLSFTTLGDGLLICMILGCFLLINPRIAIAGLAVFLLASIVVNLVKYMIPSARPLELMQIVHVTGPALRWGSFPSGHTAAGLSASLVLMSYAHGYSMKVMVSFIAVLIGLSRIFVGAHFPSDVLWGAICAITTYYIVRITIWSKIETITPDRPDFSVKLFRSAFFLQCGLSLFGLLVYSIRFSEYPPAGVAISVGVIAFVCIKLFEIAPLSGND